LQLSQRAAYVLHRQLCSDLNQPLERTGIQVDRYTGIQTEIIVEKRRATARRILRYSCHGNLYVASSVRLLCAEHVYIDGTNYRIPAMTRKVKKLPQFETCTAESEQEINARTTRDVIIRMPSLPCGMRQKAVSMKLCGVFSAAA
jgi:hypothetical protein